jgi:putative acyl-CoA dehydrogenase
VLDDGKANEGFRVMRLKNKIGDRSNASSEVEYHDAVGYLIGEHGRGVKTIMEMVALTRLDCATGSAGIMRSAVFSAGLHVSQRKAFGKTLLQQMSMAGVLADLEVHEVKLNRNAVQSLQGRRWNAKRPRTWHWLLRQL